MIRPVPLEKCYLLLNIGATVLVSAEAQGRANAMAAAWACAVDYMPKPKVSVVLDKAAFTRSLIEQNGLFALQIPVVRQAETVLKLGSSSGRDNPRKIEESGAKTFKPEGCPVPLIEGCAGWLLCRVMPNETMQQEHDLFVGEVLAAWADDAVFDGHWHFETAGDEWRTLHYVAGGHFYTIGAPLTVAGYDKE
ncbi:MULTISPECIES: flavin reductase family protein [unclassified Neisseria]|uniref:flavin reductase family protein n=1 Tax=unclassified Neisseria TaxID=2623750 RepID=UPI0005661A29|nr:MULTISPECIES: flavin reductase family protein [unclassified Neisseria]